MALPFPEIDPVAFSLGPLAVRWYGLAYLAGFLLGWRYSHHLALRAPYLGISPKQVEDFLVWAVLGVVLGGRAGYVLFYQFSYYTSAPLEALQLWHGGMSFHGGFLGFLIAALWFCRKTGVEALRFGDMLACAAPLGLFFGRLANFINGELFGRVSDVPWAMVFPGGGDLPRHPSQLYHAAGEGLLLFLVLYFLARHEGVRRRPGLLIGVFLAGYALLRSLVEVFREPDPQIGFLFGGITMGQLLSVPMLLAGLWLIRFAQRRPPVAA